MSGVTRDAPVSRRRAVTGAGALTAAAALIAVPLRPGEEAAAVALTVVMAVVTAVAALARDRTVLVAVGIADVVVVVALVGALSGLALLASWPVPVLAALALAWLLRPAFVPGEGRAPRWLAMGTVTPGSLLLVAVTLVGASLALLAWAVLADPPAPPFVSQVADAPVAVAVLGVLAFSMVNALAEEFLYRGVLLGALVGVMPVSAAVGVQSVAFGAAHWGGFPSGWAGVLLSTGYGALLGVIRLRSGGIALPWAAHVGADITIGLLGFALLAGGPA